MTFLCYCSTCSSATSHRAFSLAPKLLVVSIVRFGHELPLPSENCTAPQKDVIMRGFNTAFKKSPFLLDAGKVLLKGMLDFASMPVTILEQRISRWWEMGMRWSALGPLPCHYYGWVSSRASKCHCKSQFSLIEAKLKFDVSCAHPAQ